MIVLVDAFVAVVVDDDDDAVAADAALDEVGGWSFFGYTVNSFIGYIVWTSGIWTSCVNFHNPANAR